MLELKRVAGCLPGAMLAMALSPTAANAGLITQQFSITAQDMSFGFVNHNTAPTDPLLVTATLTFDPSLTVTDVTSGISLDSINIALDSSSFAFSYDSTSDLLSLGLLENGTDTVVAGTKDFAVQIFQAESPTPHLSLAAYSAEGLPSGDDVFEASDGTVSSTTLATPVPEPGSLPLLLTGLTGLGFLQWRRRAKTA